MDREYKLNIEALFYPLSVSKSRYKIAHIFVDDGFHISVSLVAVSSVAVDFLSIDSIFIKLEVTGITTKVLKLILMKILYAVL